MCALCDSVSWICWWYYCNIYNTCVKITSSLQYVLKYLIGDQLVVNSIFLHKIVMRTMLKNFAILKTYNCICSHDSWKSVCDNYGCPSLASLQTTLLKPHYLNHITQTHLMFFYVANEYFDQWSLLHVARQKTKVTNSVNIQRVFVLTFFELPMLRFLSSTG